MDFVARQNLSTNIQGSFGARFTTGIASEERDHRFWRSNVSATGDFFIDPPTPDLVEAVIKVRELWRTRKRNFPNDAEGVAHALNLQKQSIRLVGPDVACDLFFAEERSTGNRATGQRRSRSAGRIRWALAGVTMIITLSDPPGVFSRI